MLDLFMNPRTLLWRGIKADTVLPVRSKPSDPAMVHADSITPGSKNQAKKEKKLQLAAAKKLQKVREKDLANTGVDGATPSV